MLIPCMNPLPAQFPRDDSFVVKLVEENIQFLYKFAVDGLIRGILNGFFTPFPKVVKRERENYLKFLKQEKNHNTASRRPGLNDFFQSEELAFWFGGKKRGASITEIYQKYVSWAETNNAEILVRGQFRSEILTNYRKHLTLFHKTKRASFYALVSNY